MIVINLLWPFFYSKGAASNDRHRFPGPSAWHAIFAFPHTLSCTANVSTTPRNPSKPRFELVPGSDFWSNTRTSKPTCIYALPSLIDLPGVGSVQMGCGCVQTDLLHSPPRCNLEKVGVSAFHVLLSFCSKTSEHRCAPPHP